MRSRLLLVPLLVPLFACADQLATAPNVTAPRFDIADAARDYKQGFYWLPPMVKQPDVSGTFDATLSPTVEICELVGNECGPVLATYTLTTGPGGEYIRLADDQHYHVNWHTDEFELSSTSTYRISVRAGVNDVLLGYADVQPAANGAGLKNLDSDELMGLVDGRTLPIKFRIETGIVGHVDVQPLEATASPGATQQFEAIVTDLHGNPISADVVWASSDENVATIDQNGLATAVGDGVATITATVDRISGSATLTVEAGGVVVISAGDAHTCAVNTEGVAYCWGLGSSGQLGNASQFNQFTPVAVAGGHTFTAITAAEVHTCGVTTTGQAYCWGFNNVGQLGNGSTGGLSAVPLPVSGDHSFTSIAAGAVHTCGLTTDARILCWGFGGSGALGTGTTASSNIPVPISADLTFSALTAGRSHTCGLTTTGQAYCWGFNNSGQLGDGTVLIRSTPTLVSGDLTFSSIAGGDTHTCAITTAGAAYCWGSNLDGRLGIGTTDPSYSVPQSVSGGLTFSTITAGEAHTCAITTDGAAYCWGSNGGGRLGIGTTVLNSLVPAAVLGGHVFQSIDAGEHTCGATTGNAVYCWGPGGSGRLGNGSPDNQFEPAVVVGI